MQNPSLYADIKSALIAVLGTLNLPGLKEVRPELAEDGLGHYPRLTVTEFDEHDKIRVKILPGDSLHRDSEFPVRVYVEDTAPRSMVQKEHVWLGWLKAVTDRFHQMPGRMKLPNVPECWNVVITTLNTFDFKGKKFEQVCMGIELGFQVSEHW